MRNFISSEQSGPAATARDQSDLQDLFDERAAIAEFEGGIPRAWAEGFARLQMTACPAAMRPDRWRQMIDDAGRFLDRWAAKAAALGWDTASVFGVHADRPIERVDCAGLVWLLRGDEIGRSRPAWRGSEREAALFKSTIGGRGPRWRATVGASRMMMRDLDSKPTRRRIAHVLGEIITAAKPDVVDGDEPLVGMPQMFEVQRPSQSGSARLVRDPSHLDSIVDVAGYAACLREVTREV